MEKPLVSIITPCYNGESFIKRYFDSILKQTYSNIELFFVNDGSTDQTESIALSYREELEKKGIKFFYIYQENAGQAAAINKALPLFNGKYLTWPDSDDWMSDDCIEKKVEYLETHPEKGLVWCKLSLFSESDLSQEMRRLERKNLSSGKLFDDLIFERDIYFPPGGYMVRSEMFLNALPERQIYPSKAGQNWQLLLPITFQYECGFLDEALNFILVREQSHSRIEKTYLQLTETTYAHQDILEHVIKSISMPEDLRNKYLKEIEIKYARKRLHLACCHSDKNTATQMYTYLRKNKVLTSKDIIAYYRSRSKIIDLLIIATRPIRNIFKKN